MNTETIKHSKRIERISRCEKDNFVIRNIMSQKLGTEEGQYYYC